MGRMKKILLILLVGIVVSFIVLGLIMPYFGAIRPETARKLRCIKLQLLHQKVESFIQENQRLPESLFEALHKDLEKDGWCFGISPTVSGFPDELRRDPFLGVNDPNLFEKIIEYGFFSGRRGWFIRELKPDKIYTKMLMIDQDGRIYDFEEIPPSAEIALTQE